MAKDENKTERIIIKT